MTKAILKWLAAVGVGAVVAGLQYAAVSIGVIPDGVDPLIGGIVVMLITKAVTWALSLIKV